jgi:hypothetical protein
MSISTLRMSGLQIRDLSLAEIAHNAYYFPRTYLTLSELQKKTRSIALNALSNAPIMIQNEATPIEIRSNKEMIKTALISAYNQNNHDLYCWLLFLNPDLNPLATELEETFSALSVQEGRSIRDGSELFKIQSFYTCLFPKLSPILQRYVFQKEAPAEIRDHSQLAYQLTRRNPHLFTFMSTRCRETKAIAKAAVQVLPRIFLNLSPTLQRDPEMRHAKVQAECLLRDYRREMRITYRPTTSMVSDYPPDELQAT